MDVATLDDHVAEIDANAERDAPVVRQAGVDLNHPLLQVDGTLDGIHRAGELNQGAVAHQLDDPAAMLRNHWFEDGFPAVSKRSQRAGLIRLHEATVTDHISGKDCCETAFHAGSLGNSDPIVIES
jgi:hypothetical protein